MEREEVREKLMELLLEVDSVCGVGDCEECVDDGICFMHRAVDNLIANNVVIQKQGEWVSKRHDDGYGEFTLWHCSQCDVPSANKRNFCHYCGAKMEGVV